MLLSYIFLKFCLIGRCPVATSWVFTATSNRCEQCVLYENAYCQLNARYEEFAIELHAIL